ncbi:MAG: hypothetical protein KKF44_10130 [Nanoarchaeota archaeon]|nr:hypothetical protein [Nanoarchaeota archaeon]
MKKIDIIVTALALGLIFTLGACTEKRITSFDECVAAGNPILESYPAQCRTKDGQSFTQVIDSPIEPEPTNPIEISCTKEQKAANICTMEYLPVCGDNGKTYGNKCGACASGEVESYAEGECSVVKEPIVGGDSDEHGCKGSAGYTWCEEKQKCLRVWEEECPGLGLTPDTIDAEMLCKTDTDCIPLPSDCHPTTCINKKFQNNHEAPQMCTMEFRENAAYAPEDCLCVSTRCINKNA